MRSQKAQLDERGRGAGGEGKVSAADLLWLLPRPARLNLRHTKHGALELPLLVLSHTRLLATLSMALTEGCIPLEPTRDSSREFCLDTPPPTAPPLLPPCLAPPPPPLLLAPLLLRVSCWAVMATGPPLLK